MTTPLKPGDRVLVEAVVKEVYPCGCTVQLEHVWDHIYDSNEEVHPLPAPVWVARDSGMEFCNVWSEKPDCDRLENDCIWFRAGNSKADLVAQIHYSRAGGIGEGECRKMHLLAIAAKEGE